jgi:mono/diheme cytochrome c family protein
LKAQDLRSDVVQKKSDAELTAAITLGKGKMPAFGKKLKPDDIAKLVAFIRALPKK